MTTGLRSGARLRQARGKAPGPRQSAAGALGYKSKGVLSRSGLGQADRGERFLAVQPAFLATDSRLQPDVIEAAFRAPGGILPVHGGERVEEIYR